jgi:hypothetical protein
MPTPLRTLTDRLGNTGTLLLIATLILATFLTLDYRQRHAPSPRLVLLSLTWQDYAKAALSRDAPPAAFDRAITTFNIHLARLQHLQQTSTEPTLPSGLADLERCRDWLYTYRQTAPQTTASDNAQAHIEACPLKP